MTLGAASVQIWVGQVWPWIMASSWICAPSWGGGQNSPLIQISNVVYHDETGYILL